MPAGPGKYDSLATMVRTRAAADGVVVIVLNGNQGNGFSVQASREVLITLPALLRGMADEIENQPGWDDLVNA